MKKLLIGILLCFVFVSVVQAETFTEANVASDGVDGRSETTIVKTVTGGVTTIEVWVNYSTVDAGGTLIKHRRADITSTLNPGQLTAINAILTKGLAGAKTHAKIP